LNNLRFEKMELGRYTSGVFQNPKVIDGVVGGYGFLYLRIGKKDV
jgi:hypothetical protein